MCSYWAWFLLWIATKQKGSLLLLIIIIIVVVVVVSCHRPFLPGNSLQPTVIPSTQNSSFRLQYLPYYVWCSKYSCLFLVNPLNAFLVWLTHFSLNLLLLFWWLQLLLASSYISCSTFVVSQYINSCILVSILLPFAWNFCPQVLPHLALCLFSLFVFNYYVWPVCCTSLFMYHLIP
jgi:hypothetical protein